VTTSRLTYLLGQVPSKMAEDPTLKALLHDLLWDPGQSGDKARYLLDLRNYTLEGAKDGVQGPFQVKDERLVRARDHDDTSSDEWSGLKENAGQLAELLAGLLEASWGLKPVKRGERVLYSLALRGTPLAEMAEYREYLRRLLNQDERFAKAKQGLCHGCGRFDNVLGDFTAFQLKFYITDKKSFAPGVKDEAFLKAFALCPDCFSALSRGERFAWNHLKLRFLGAEVLVLPEADLEHEKLSLLVDRLLAEVRGLERLSAWREFLGQAAMAWEEVGYLGFSLLFFRRSNAATKAEEAVLEVPPSRVETLVQAMEAAEERGFPIGGLSDWLSLMPLNQRRGGGETGLALRAVAQLFQSLPFHPSDLIPLWLKAAERAYRDDRSLLAHQRYQGPQGALDLVALGAGWIWILVKLNLWGETMNEELSSSFPLDEEAIFREYRFGPLEAGLYLLGKAMEAVGHAQAKLSNYRKEPLLDSIGWQGMSLVRIRHLVPEIIEKANYYLDGDGRTRVLELMGRATDLLERAEGGRSEREIPYYLLMGYAQARSQRLRARKENEDAA
jgi:CRISPR-associated protein Csh1